jgi:hypothetical protein
MKIALFAAVIAMLSPLSVAAPSVDGEYTCNDCHGLLTLKKNKGESYKLWLGSGGGSCGGDVIAKGNFILSPNKRFTIHWKNKGRICTTEIRLDGDNAHISDSCIRPEDEANSTCAIMGDYTKRDRVR